MIERLLCWLGWHEWNACGRLDSMGGEEFQSFEALAMCFSAEPFTPPIIIHSCRHCPCMRFHYNGSNKIIKLIPFLEVEES